MGTWLCFHQGRHREYGHRRWRGCDPRDLGNASRPGIPETVAHEPSGLTSQSPSAHLAVSGASRSPLKVPSRGFSFLASGEIRKFTGNARRFRVEKPENGTYGILAALSTPGSFASTRLFPSRFIHRKAEMQSISGSGGSFRECIPLLASLGGGEMRLSFKTRRLVLTVSWHAGATQSAYRERNAADDTPSVKKPAS